MSGVLHAGRLQALSCVELSLFCCVTADKYWLVEVGPADKVFRLSLHQRFPGPVQTCEECGLNSFKMFPERVRKGDPVCL